MGAPATLAIVYEDTHLVAVEKPGGLLVHRTQEAAAEKRALLQEARDQLGGAWLYPVHRLDRAASGIVLFGKSPEDARDLQASLARDDTLKLYLALVSGPTPARWVVDRLLTRKSSGKKRPSRTDFECRETIRVDETHMVCVVAARLHTGRRHQIRRHLAGQRHPILGDTTYGKGRINRFYRSEFGLPRLCLHATQIVFAHPATGQTVDLESPLPSELDEFLSKIR